MFDPTFSILFWSKVDKSTLSGCWEWVDYRRNNYGMVFVDGKVLAAHRVSWILSRGSIPDGQGVLHHCDNPPCVNPSHLFLGTNGDNNRDRHAKGRSYKIAIRYGEDSYSSKLTVAQVVQIKIALASGCGTSELGRLYGVNHMTIHAIKKGTAWVQVSVPALEEKEDGKI
jgi:hypothetical protein